ncbi:MAG: hypothetical protein C0425_08955 [Chlorobiaceae bacterium]|nr:hypothetical protein [Chlorobiaceae bacterium]MBA4310451.1 hypothetical protein [Chlorobiaceae bacterium]
MSIILKLKKHLPNCVYTFLRHYYRLYKFNKFRKYGRPKVYAETSKAKERRIREKFFELYCSGKGLDIGYGGDKLLEGSEVWDFEHGDAQFMTTIKNETYDFVYSSHTLEHMPNPQTALKNWFRIVNKGGYLILYIPHRDLYEKKKTLPSSFNSDHISYFLIDIDEAPDTIGIIPLVQRTLLNYEVVYAKECKENYSDPGKDLQSSGEYSIEIVIKKK